VQVWGSDDINRLKKASSAAAVDGVKGAALLTAGFGQTCAILRDDSVLCFAAWQDPVKVDSVGKVSRIAVRSSAAEREIGCAVVKDTARVPSHVACWGFTDVADVDSYRRIPLPGTPLDVAMGSEHTCALVEDGPTSVWCWGRNTKGQLGQGSVSDDSSLVQTPQRVSALDGLGIAALTAGVESMFARSNTGKAYAWGFNEDLGLATGRVVGAVAVPTAMIGVCQ
jgi:alpha-tubulin suppressor-like RCC1 family protein